VFSKEHRIGNLRLFDSLFLEQQDPKQIHIEFRSLSLARSHMIIPAEIEKFQENMSFRIFAEIELSH